MVLMVANATIKISVYVLSLTTINAISVYVLSLTVLTTTLSFNAL